MPEILILELPKEHIDIILKMLEFGQVNPSLDEYKVKILKEIYDHIERQVAVSSS